MEPRRPSSVEADTRVAEIVERLVRALDPERILLFGSFARGDYNRASDIDLVVIAHSGAPLYIATRYPNGLPDNIPHDFYDRKMADQALADLQTVITIARRFVPE